MRIVYINCGTGSSIVLEFFFQVNVYILLLTCWLDPSAVIPPFFDTLLLLSSSSSLLSSLMLLLLNRPIGSINKDIAYVNGLKFQIAYAVSAKAYRVKDNEHIIKTKKQHNPNHHGKKTETYIVVFIIHHHPVQQRPSQQQCMRLYLIFCSMYRLVCFASPIPSSSSYSNVWHSYIYTYRIQFILYIMVLLLLLLLLFLLSNRKWYTNDP